MKYALIGCSRISDKHLAAARDNNLDVVAVVDLAPNRMTESIARHGLDGVGQYTDHKLMLERERPELVSIATGSGSHASIALDCIERGVHVIIEKPIAMSLADADEIIARSEARQVKVAVCHQLRFNKSVQQTRRALLDGRFGKLSHGSVHVRWNRDREYYAQASWRGTWAQDGGCLLNQCIHGIDLLRWLIAAGSGVESVFGVTRRQFHSYLETEDLGMAIVKFENGAIATIEGTTNVYPRNLEETLYIFGETGTVKLGGKLLDTIDVWNVAEPIDHGSSDHGSIDHDSIERDRSGHSKLFADVIDAIEREHDPLVDARAGRDALELVLAIYKSSVEGKAISLPLEACSTTEFVGVFDRRRE